MTADADFAVAMNGLRPRDEPLDRARVLSAVLARQGAGASDTVRVGRYVLRRRLGRGGQGVVWAAWDPELQRSVALKVIAPRAGETRATETHRDDRIRREARALARVEHANVARVYDVGAPGDDVFVVMELVHGLNLARWLEIERPVREVIDVFVRAGRGLAAVHAQGLVHHDFKPANVMVTDGTTVKVVDFGLARLLDPLATPTHPPQGTLRYMAPEQRGGDVGNAASDQFAFCVALRDALGRRVSPRLKAVLRRGLQPRPDDRWPSMDTLLGAIDSTRGRDRAARAGVAVASVVLVMFVAAAVDRSPAGACDVPPSSWSGATKGDVVAWLSGSGLDPAARQSGLAAIDVFASDWIAARARVCARPPDDSETQASRRCLRRLEARLRTLVEGMDSTEPAAHAAWRAAGQLPSPSMCTTKRGRLPQPAAAQDRQTAAALRERLATATALVDSARAPEAKPRIAELRREASDLGFAPLEAEAAFVAGWAAVQTRDLDVAVGHLEDAVYLGSRSGHDHIVADAAVKLTFVVGKLQAQRVRGLRWGEHAAAAVARVGSPAELEGELASAIGRLRLSHGDLAGAEADLKRAVVQQTEALGADDVRLAAATTALGMALQGQGRYAEALAVHEGAVALFEGAGVRHPDRPTALAGLASAHMLADDLDAARAGFEGAIEASERIHGSDDPFAGPLFANLATIYWRVGQPDAAAEGYRRALDIETAKASPHPQVLASIHTNIAALSNHLEDAETAVTHYEIALALFDEQGGACTPNYAATLFGLGGALLRRGHIDEARTRVQAAVSCARQLGVDHPYLAEGLLILGEVEWEAGRAHETLDLAEEALGVSTRNPAVAGAESRASFLLAMAQWETGADKQGAVERARAVARAYAKEPSVRPGHAEQVRAWLQAHR